MKDVLLLHDNAQPHTVLRKREAIVKVGWTVLSHPLLGPGFAPFDYHMFGPVNDALLDAILQMTTN
jgi:hypothetical protein